MGHLFAESWRLWALCGVELSRAVDTIPPEALLTSPLILAVDGHTQGSSAGVKSCLYSRAGQAIERTKQCMLSALPVSSLSGVQSPCKCASAS
ncbi:mCG123851 [Mus musculus]|uniref:Uncharacterized protein n=1 Tax=Mus musculus TaxID=10090 RepID=Q3UZ34_MOUSE|nr:mCG123851 [Mus musculus]BAE22027.1 unnamed protein product [Mus musculus]